MLLNCGVGVDSWESLGLQGNQVSQSWRKSVLNVHWKDWSWSWSSNMLAMWRTDSLEKTLMLGKIEGRRRRGRQRWDDWMASLTQWTWVWASFGVADGHEHLLCCSRWGCKESDMTEWLNWTEKASESHSIATWGQGPRSCHLNEVQVEKCLLRCTPLCIVPFSLKTLDFISSTHIPNTRVIQTWDNYNGNHLEVGE